MLLNETGFIFDGKHSRTHMGLIYAEKDGHIISPKIQRNAYEIAGVSGTVLLGGEVWQTITFEGTLYPAQERTTQREAQTMLRDVAAWLTAGRRELIFDYEPGVYYMAELSAATKWSLKNWFGGELPIKFEAQPFAYNVGGDVAMSATTGSAVSVTVNARTGAPAPLGLSVYNTGDAPITGVAVRFSGDSADSIVMSGMNLAYHQALEIEMEPPIGARIGGENALQYASAFTPMALKNGANNIYVQLTYGIGTKGAMVTASARGRW